MKNSLFFLLLLGLLAWLMPACEDPTPAEPCDAPVELQAVTVGPTEIGINWLAPSNVDSFEVRINPQSNPPSPFTTSNTNFELTGLTPNTLYQIEVRSICNGQRSEPATINVRTTEIIIIEIISQLSDQQMNGAIQNLCQNGTVFDNAYNWDGNFPDELMQVDVLSPTNQVLSRAAILKQTANGVTRFSVPREGIRCANGATLIDILSAPAIISSNTANSGVVNGSGYTLTISNTGVVFNGTGLTAKAFIYR